MIFQFIPVAEANITTLMESINNVIINPLIIFLFALAIVYFIFGILQFLLNPESEDNRKKGKAHMLWGIIGMFIMVAVFGIMNFILKNLGEDKIKIDNTGNIEIESRNIE